jgi:hypothetical protein
MKSTALTFIFLALFLAQAQQSDLFTKAPPDVDEALRSRITIFYQAHIIGKYSDAFQLVADDSRDTFLGSGRDSYKSCEITKINYSENFTKASVVTACKGELHWRGERMPATMPIPSTWKLVNGQWYWYSAKRDEVQTPFGVSRVTGGNNDATQMPAIPADPLAVARDILRKVAVDKTEVQLKGYETSQDELHLINNMPGPIRFSVTFPPSKGVTIKPEKSELQSGEKATIVFAYDLEEAAALCRDCLKVVKPSLTANIQVEPTGQVFPVTVTFAIPPELQKLIPPQVQPPKP